MKAPLITAVLTIALISDSWAAKSEDTAVIFIQDDSGVVQNPEEMDAIKMHLLAEFKALSGRFHFKHTHLEVISTSLGRTVWVGSPDDLKTARASDLVNKIKTKPDHCNSLHAVFDDLNRTLQLIQDYGHSKIHIIFLSPLIDTPIKPCGGGVSIKLPQLPPPVNFVKAFTADAIRSITLLGVNPYQERLYQEALSPVRDWAKQGGRIFEIYNRERTLSFLKKLKLTERLSQ